MGVAFHFGMMRKFWKWRVEVVAQQSKCTKCHCTPKNDSDGKCYVRLILPQLKHAHAHAHTRTQCFQTHTMKCPQVHVEFSHGEVKYKAPHFATRALVR